MSVVVGLGSGLGLGLALKCLEQASVVMATSVRLPLTRPIMGNEEVCSSDQVRDVHSQVSQVRPIRVHEGVQNQLCPQVT